MVKPSYQDSYQTVIPVAVATADDDPYGGYGTTATPTLTKGRSSRVVVPEDEGLKPLTDDDVFTLNSQGYTSGLITALSQNRRMFPLRIWVVDNSGSMSMGDGHRMVETRDARQVKLVKCSRWTELRETVDYHANMAALLEAPTVFRLLNDPGQMVGPQQFSIAERGAHFIEEDLQVAKRTMAQTTPSGCTPLADHVREIRENIFSMGETLRQRGQKVAVILATDGLPTDPYGVSSHATRGEFEAVLRSLEGLPVWIVIRLCTDEESVVEYYNNLDAQLELSLEVLDDFTGEAEEVHEANPWLNYSLCLHRIREMGFHHRLFDLLDERLFTLDEVKEFMVLLLGVEAMDGMPDPQIDFKEFLDHLSIRIHHEKSQWNPVSKKVVPWIDVKKMKKCYAEGACSIM